MTAIVDEESPLATTEFVILPDWMPSKNLAIVKYFSFLLLPPLHLIHFQKCEILTKIAKYGIHMGEFRSNYKFGPFWGVPPRHSRKFVQKWKR
jgi:hypothetical protein